MGQTHRTQEIGGVCERAARGACGQRLRRQSLPTRHKVVSRGSPTFRANQSFMLGHEPRRVIERVRHETRCLSGGVGAAAPW